MENKLFLFFNLFQVEQRHAGGRVVPPRAGEPGEGGPVPGGGPRLHPRHCRGPHAGTLRQRSGPGVCAGLPHPLLAPGPSRVQRVQGQHGQNGELPFVYYVHVYMIDIQTGGYKEMSSFFADQSRPRMRVPMRGDGGVGLRGLSQ
jgi:hypothetical protein